MHFIHGVEIHIVGNNMMEVIQIHIGDAFPNYAIKTFSTITQYSGSQCLVHINKDVRFYDVVEVVRFRELSHIFDPGMDRFWISTAERLFYLSPIMKDKKATRALHIENDCPLYTDPNKLEPIMHKLYKNCVAFCPCGPTMAAASVMYVDSLDAIAFLTEAFIEALKMGKEKLVKAMETNQFVTEMKILCYLQKLYPNRIKYLPILPTGPHSLGVEEFNSLFDPASWGQFVGGTNNGHAPGFATPDHWIGQAIREKKYDVIWEKKQPYVRDGKTGQMWKLNNLHIHCKDIKKYI